MAESMSKVASDIDRDTVRNDVRSLKGDFETFLHDLKSGTFEAAGRGADEVVKRVKQRPLSSILIAVGIGFVSGRLLFR